MITIDYSSIHYQNHGIFPKTTWISVNFMTSRDKQRACPTFSWSLRCLPSSGGLFIGPFRQQQTEGGLLTWHSHRVLSSAHNHEQLPSGYVNIAIENDHRNSGLMGFYSDLMGYSWDIPSGYVKIAMENGHRNSEFSHWKRWIFPVRYANLLEGTSTCKSIESTRDDYYMVKKLRTHSIYICSFQLWDANTSYNMFKKMPRTGKIKQPWDRQSLIAAL